MNTEKLLDLVAPYDRLALECDGMTRLLSTALLEAHIPHRVFQGQLFHTPTQEIVTPHLWIELETEQGLHTLDYRARLWLRGKPQGTVPHGLFQASHYPNVQYQEAHELDPVPLEPTQRAWLLTHTYGTFVPCGYRTEEAGEYLDAWMEHERSVLVETRYTPFAYKTRRLPDAARWCRYGPQGLERTYGDRYNYYCNKNKLMIPTSGTKQDRLNWLGNVNYKQPGAPIVLVNEKMGLSMLHMILCLGLNVIALCGCPADRYEIEAEDDRFSGCHLRYIGNRLEEMLPGLPIVRQAARVTPPL